jgi:hypothetical protein
MYYAENISSTLSLADTFNGPVKRSLQEGGNTSSMKGETKVLLYEKIYYYAVLAVTVFIITL